MPTFLSVWDVVYMSSLLCMNEWLVEEIFPCVYRAFKVHKCDSKLIIFCTSEAMTSPITPEQYESTHATIRKLNDIIDHTIVCILWLYTSIFAKESYTVIHGGLLQSISLCTELVSVNQIRMVSGYRSIRLISKDSQLLKSISFCCSNG